MPRRNGRSQINEEKAGAVQRTHDAFHVFAHKAAEAVGSPGAFVVAVVVLVVWAITGPIFHYSDTWQLIINTATTIVTFLMVFLIQNTQNRDARAIHLKLDELIRSKKGARNRLVDLVNYTDDELAEIEEEFRKVHDEAVRRKKHARPVPGATRNGGKADAPGRAAH